MYNEREIKIIDLMLEYLYKNVDRWNKTDDIFKNSEINKNDLINIIASLQTDKIIKLNPTQSFETNYSVIIEPKGIQIMRTYSSFSSFLRKEEASLYQKQHIENMATRRANISIILTALGLIIAIIFGILRFLK